MFFSSSPIPLRLAGIVAALALLGGCATPKDPRDPFEPVNRAIYRFNKTVDTAVVEPTAKVYRFVLPSFVRTSVGNVVSNAGEIRNVLNNSLQGKFGTAYSTFGRLAMNSTLGLLGLFDVASEAGIEKRPEDFGQTLAVWGVADGPFMMLPIFGPSSVRDTVAWPADIYVDPFSYVDPTRARNQIWAGRVVHQRSELLDAKKVIESAALDEYQFVRDAYLQRRRNLVYDGKPPPDTLVKPPAPDTRPPPPNSQK
jgi:phospholipid-binding lipoprotein MlaA